MDIDNTFLVALRNRKIHEARRLLDTVKSVDVQEKATGKTCLHYAVSVGSVEIVMKLLERGAEVNSRDKDNDTPLHLATQGKYETITVLLVVFGGKLELKNKHGQTALSMAIHDKSPRMVDILLKLEEQPSVKEWDWVISEKMGGHEKQIIEAFKRQCSFLPGFKNGLVKSDLLYVKPNVQCCSTSLEVEIDTSGVSSPFVFQCYKMQLEYAKVGRHLKKEEDFFSDMYECRIWNCKDKELSLMVTVNDHISAGRKLKFIPIEKSVGRIKGEYDTVEDENSNQKTIVIISITPRNGEYSKFTIASVERRERVKVSKEAVTLNPIVLPGTEIKVPQDAFAQESNLSLKVIKTEETNKEEDKCLIVTNALGINTDGVQPQKDIDMTLPVHTKMGSNEVVVLASETDHPDSVNDWKIIEPVSDSNTDGAVSFKTNHFSLFVGVAKAFTCTNSGLAELHEVLDRTIARKKKVVFLVLSKANTEEEGGLSVIVQCGLSRRQRALQEKWKEEGYKLVSSSDDLVCAVNSVFQVVLSGNIEEVFHSKQLDLEFHLSRENYRVFNVCVVDKEKEAMGQVSIQKQDVTIRVEVVGEEHSGCFVWKQSTPVSKEVEDVESSKLFECNLPFVKEVNRNAKLRKVFDGFRLMSVHKRHVKSADSD